MADNYLFGGGYRNKLGRTPVDDYAWRAYGPADDNDAVIFNGKISSNVEWVSGQDFIPRGRIFTQDETGDYVPGTPDVAGNARIPIPTILIGSDADSPDVIGIPGGDPAKNRDAYLAGRAPSAPFVSLAAGYVVETSEFDQSIPATNFVYGTPLTSTQSDVQGNFDVCGVVKIGTVYTDTIIGSVTQPPADSDGPNHGVQVIQFEGLFIPRLTSAAATLRP